MSSNQYTKERKEDKPVLAICYDFDKTLSPDDMQAQGYIQSVGYDVGEFWTESNGLASQNDMDQNLAYMLLMKKKAAGKLVFTRENLENYGAKVSLFPGVEDWFERIRAYGAEHGVIVEHYIISSGLKEMIEGTSVAKNGAFKRIYASSFYYDSDGVAEWPAQVVNYTNKTQFLFRIEKGVLDINDPGVNDSGDYSQKSVHASKHGSPVLRKTLFQVMDILIKTKPDDAVYLFMNKKRTEGKPYYVYMTAGANKFLRRYYAKVRDYLATLDGLPPVDMDSTGLSQPD